MITIISGTNRPGGNSRKVAKKYAEICNGQGFPSQVLSLEELPSDFAFSEMYGKRTDTYNSLINQFIERVDKFVFIIPEYNGSFPGVLKAFIDSVHPKFFRGKKAALVGVSSGRAGNLRGLSDLTGVLHYLQVEVMAKKPKLSGIEGLIDDEGNFTDEQSIEFLQEQVQKFKEF